MRFYMTKRKIRDFFLTHYFFWVCEYTKEKELIFSKKKVKKVVIFWQIFHFFKLSMLILTEKKHPLAHYFFFQFANTQKKNTCFFSKNKGVQNSKHTFDGNLPKSIIFLSKFGQKTQKLSLFFKKYDREFKVWFKNRLLFDILNCWNVYLIVHT